LLLFYAIIEGKVKIKMFYCKQKSYFFIGEKLLVFNGVERRAVATETSKQQHAEKVFDKEIKNIKANRNEKYGYYRILVSIKKINKIYQHLGQQQKTQFDRIKKAFAKIVFKKEIDKLKKYKVSRVNSGGFGNIVNSVLMLNKFKEYFSPKQLEVYENAKRKLINKTFPQAIKKIQSSIAKQDGVRDIEFTLGGLLRLKPLLPDNLRRTLDALTKKVLLFIKKDIKRYIGELRAHNYQYYTKDKSAEIKFNIDTYKTIINKVGEDLKIRKLLYNNYQKEFTALIQVFINKTHKEYERIKKTKDYSAYGALLGLLDWSSYFSKEPFPKSALAKLNTLKTKVIQDIVNTPDSEIKKIFSNISREVANLRLIMPQITRERLKGIEGVKKTGNKYVIDIEGQDWIISNPGEHPNEITISLKGKEKEVFRTVSFKSFVKGKKLNMPHLIKETRQALFDYAKQEKNKHLLKNFDLPKNRKIGYISLFDPKFDLTRSLSQVKNFSILLVKILKSRGYNIDLSAMEGKPFVDTNEPIKYMTTKVEELYSRGIRDFYLDFNAHGIPGKVMIGKGVTGDTLVNLFKKYPDCRFNITSIACYGGGLRKGILNYLKSPKGRKRAEDISLFLQAKPSRPNTAATLGAAKSGRAYVSNYYVHFARFLLQGMSFGEAAYAADIEVKKYYPNDAEAIVDGKLIS
jgi:hypothetical protein